MNFCSHHIITHLSLLKMNEYCGFPIEGFFPIDVLLVLLHIVVTSRQVELKCWDWSRI